MSRRTRRQQPNGRHARIGALVSALLALAFSGVYAAELLARHETFNTYAFDLGLLTQTAWESLHGHWFVNTVMSFNYLAEHLSPALVLFSPLLLAWPDARVFLCLQAVAVGATGFGIYLAARSKTADPISALLVQLAYHVAPATGWVVRDEFHPISLAMPAVAFATALLWRKHPRLAALVAGLALLANEDAALWGAPFGLLVLVVARGRDRLAGVTLSILATAWLVAYVFWVVPSIRPPELGETVPHPDIGAFSQCGRSLPEVVDCLVRNPVATMARVTSPGDLEAIAAIFGPTAGLGFFGPSALVALGRWLVLLLGNDPPNYRAHYVAVLVPAAYLAAAEAIGGLRRWPRLSPRLPAALLAAVSIAALAQDGADPVTEAFSWLTTAPDARVAALHEALTLIPKNPNVTVAATSSLLAHLATRESVYLISEGQRVPVDYRIFDLRDPYPTTSQELARIAALARANPCYREVFDRLDILVLRGKCRFPAESEVVTFGGALRLVGYSLQLDGQSLHLGLFWESEAKLNADLHYFVHVVDRAGHGFGQKDGELADGMLPTSQLSVGQSVLEEIVLPAPSPSPDYRLEIGWYDPVSGKRLQIDADRDHLELPLEATGD